MRLRTTPRSFGERERDAIDVRGTMTDGPAMTMMGVRKSALALAHHSRGGKFVYGCVRVRVSLFLRIGASAAAAAANFARSSRVASTSRVGKTCDNLRCLFADGSDRISAERLRCACVVNLIANLFPGIAASCRSKEASRSGGSFPSESPTRLPS